MKSQQYFIMASAVLFVVLGLTPSPASADPYRDINRLARRIDSQAKSIARETRHFRHTPVYQCLVNDTEELRRWACHIRDHARSGYCLFQLQQNVSSLGQAYAILESKFRRVEYLSPTCNNTRRVRRLLNDIQFDIREMQLVLRSLLAPPCLGQIGHPLMGGIPTRPRHGWGDQLGFAPGQPHFGSRSGMGHQDFSRYGSGQGWGHGNFQQNFQQLGAQRGFQQNSPAISQGRGGIQFNF